MDDKTQKLYQTLYDKGLYTKTFDDFTTQFSDEVKKEKLFNSLNQKGLYTKTYEEFNSQFFPVKKKDFSLQDSLSPASGKEELPFLDASGKPLTPQQPLPSAEKPRDTTWGGDLARTLKSTSLRALGGITETPMFISNTIHALTTRPIIKALGGTDEEAQRFADYTRSLSTFGQTMQGGEDAQKMLNKEAAKTEAKMQAIEGNIVQNIQQGNWGGAAELLGRGVVGSIPYLAMTAATAGGGTAAVLGTIGATSAAQQYGDLDKIEEPKRLLNSWMYGGFEAAGELVTAGLLRGIGKSFRVGKNLDPGIVQKVNPEAAKGFAKGLLKSFGLESSSEAVTQVGQNFTDIVTGTDPNRNIFDNVLDAALIGGISGGGIGMVDIAASMLGRAMASAKETEQVQNNVKEQKVIIDQIETSDSDPVKKALESRLKTLKYEADKVMDKNYELAKTLSPEQHEKVAELYSSWNELQAKIDNREVVTEEQVTATENAIEGIKNEIEGIKEAKLKELGEVKEEGVKFKIRDKKFETVEALESWLDKNYVQKELEPVWHQPTEKAIDEWAKKNKEELDRKFFEADQKRLADKEAAEAKKAEQLKAIEDLKAAERTDEPAGTITPIKTLEGRDHYNVVNEEGQRDTFSVPEGSPQEVVRAKSEELVKPKEIGGQTNAQGGRTEDTQVTEQGAPELVGQESDISGVRNNEQVKPTQEKIKERLSLIKNDDIGDYVLNRETGESIISPPFKKYKKGDKLPDGSEVIEDFGDGEVKILSKSERTDKKGAAFVNKIDIDGTINGYDRNSDYIADEYNKAIKEGNNPELVDAINSLLGISDKTEGINEGITPKEAILATQETGRVTPPPPPQKPVETAEKAPKEEIRSGFEKRETVEGVKGSIELREDEVGRIVKDIVDKNPHFYQQLHQKDAIDQAQNLITSFKSLDDAYSNLLQKTKELGQLPIRHVARQIIMQKFGEDLRDANKSGDKQSADAIADKIINIEDITQKEVRLAGQTSAMTMWQLLTPEATVFMVQKLFNDVNRSKLGFEAQQAEDFINKWNEEVPQSIQRLLTENPELEGFINKIAEKAGSDIKTSRTTRAKAKDIATKVRSLKSTNWGLTFADPVGVTAIMDGALEVTARTIETTGNILQAIQDGIGEIKKSKWYGGLTSVRQKEVEDKFRSKIRENIDFNAAEFIEGESWYKKAEKPVTEEEQKAKAEKKEIQKQKTAASKKLKEQIYDIIAAHWLVQKKGGESLAEKLSKELGITKSEAEKISAIAEKAVEADSKKIFDKTLGEKIVNKNTKESAFNKFYKLIKRGVLTNDNYYEVFADKYNLKKGLTEEEKIKLKKLAINAEQMAPYGYFGDMAQNEFLQYMSKITEADSWLTRQSKLMVAANYARMLSGLTTHKVNLTSSGMNLFLRPLATAGNMNRWFKTLKNVLKGDFTNARLSNPLIDLYYAGGAYATGMNIGKTEAKNIIEKGNIKQASKYLESVQNLGGQNIPELEKNKFGIGKRFKPLEVPLLGGRKLELNPWNWMKYSGRTLLAEDAAMSNTAFALELALAAREKAIREGKLGVGFKENKKFAEKIFESIAGDNLTEIQNKQVEDQLAEQVQMLRTIGIEPTKSQIEQRRFELVRNLLDLTQEEVDEMTQLARSEIFTNTRGGIFSQIGDAMGRLFSKNIAIKVATMPKIPFTGVLGRAADMTVDSTPIYGAIRAKGWSPTGLIARIRQWERTGQFKDFLTEPAKAGLFKSAQLGETGSKSQDRQMARQYLGLWSTLILGSIFLGSDDDEKDKDGNPLIDITGELPFAEYDKKGQHYLGQYTAKIGDIKFRYLNYPIINMPFAIIGNYKDHVRAGVPVDEMDARLALLGHAWFHSLGMVKDTWLAKGINDLVELVGGVINTVGRKGEKETVKESDKIALREVDPRVTKQLENMRDDYTGLVIKYVDPLKSNMVQQILKFGIPEGRLKGTGKQLWMYNAGLQWWNDKRTDIFGQTVEIKPGDQGIAWPRDNDPRWKKMWDYNVNLTDISPKDKNIIGGVPRTLEWDEFIEKKKSANDLFRQRFDDYFKGLSEEDVKTKLETFTVDTRTAVKTNQIQEDLSKIWSDTKRDVNKIMFVWDKQAKQNPALFKELVNGNALPDFERPTIEIDKKKIIIPFDKLLKTNEQIMDNFVNSMKLFLDSEMVTKEFLDSEKKTPTPNKNDNPDLTKFQKRVNDMWSRSKVRPIRELETEMKQELTKQK